MENYATLLLASLIIVNQFYEITCTSFYASKHDVSSKKKNEEQEKLAVDQGIGKRNIQKGRYSSLFHVQLNNDYKPKGETNTKGTEEKQFNDHNDKAKNTVDFVDTQKNNQHQQKNKFLSSSYDIIKNFGNGGRLTYKTTIHKTITQQKGGIFGYKTHQRQKRTIKDSCHIDITNNYRHESNPMPVGYERRVVNKAKEKGALCIDGTPAVYFLRKASKQTNDWIVFVAGGAWCSSTETCFWRSQTHLGSTKYVPRDFQQGILSNSCNNNYRFCNWNVLYLQYCDGSSFLGDAVIPVQFKNACLYSRGKRILSAFMDEAIGTYIKVNSTKKVVVIGSSAGGLAVILNAHYIASKIPDGIRVEFVSDAGVFVDVRCFDDSKIFSRWMKALYTYYNVSKMIYQRVAFSM